MDMGAPNWEWLISVGLEAKFLFPGSTEAYTSFCPLIFGTQNTKSVRKRPYTENQFLKLYTCLLLCHFT